MDKEFYHHGIKGQKWGVRRYQNSDGTLTAMGRKRYGKEAINYYKKKDETDKRSFLDAQERVNAYSNELNRKHPESINLPREEALKLLTKEELQKKDKLAYDLQAAFVTTMNNRNAVIDIQSYIDSFGRKSDSANWYRVEKGKKYLEEYLKTKE